MATYLVTGAAGFIGSSLVRALVLRGEKVRCFDNLSTGSIGNLTDLIDRIELQFGDIRHQEDVDEACRGMEYIFHMADSASIEQSIQDPLGTLDVTLTGTAKLLEAARREHVKRIVFASSSAVYGSQMELPLRETHQPQPASPYAVYKMAGEQLTATAHALYGLETVSLRYFNVFGPRQSPSSPSSGLIARLAALMLAGGGPDLKIFGSGEQSRDFVYIDDVVEATLAAMHAPAAQVAGRVFNIGSGQAYTVNHTFRLLSELTGFTGKARKAATRAGEVSHALADLTAAHTAFEYKPLVSFPEGLGRTVLWHRTQTLPAVVRKQWATIPGQALTSPPALLQALQSAIPREELALVYQPIVGLRTSTVTGIEALLRWKHNDTPVPPAHFIPIAEGSGAIVPLGLWVFEHACRQAADLRQVLGREIRLAVNVTPLQIETPGFVETIKRVLQESSLPAECLEVEITERVLMKDSHTTKKTLRELRQLGIGVGIDDFGIGYSNMDYLLRYPINRIKLDRLFVSNSKRKARVLEAMSAFAHEVCIPLLAEGVESASEWKRVLQAGCDEAQGFYIARPMPYEELVEFVRQYEQPKQLAASTGTPV